VSVVLPFTSVRLIRARWTPKLVDERRMFDAVDIMLSLQNPCGGFASYELVRGPWWVEWLNAAEVFGGAIHCLSVNIVAHEPLGDIMIEYCYPECTTSAITSLAIFRKYYPHYRAQVIECVSC
jgi:lanosterol synthase